MTEKDYKIIPDLTYHIYLATKNFALVSDDKLEQLFKPDTYIDDYFTGIHRLYIGFGLTMKREKAYSFTLGSKQPQNPSEKK